MRALVLVLLVACGLPSIEDVQQATDEAVDACRDVIDDKIPVIISQVATAALLACAGLEAEVNGAEALIRESREVIAYEVLANLGCSWDGADWDCSTAPLICGEAP